MANYAILKAAIQSVIKQNGNNEITGNLLQQALVSMITSLGDGYQLAGIAHLTPAQTDPGTPDQNVFYIVSEPGTYSNFGGLIVADGEVAIFKYNGTWSKDSTGAATAAKVTELGQKLSKLDGFVKGTRDDFLNGFAFAVGNIRDDGSDNTDVYWRAYTPNFIPLTPLNIGDTLTTNNKSLLYKSCLFFYKGNAIDGYTFISKSSSGFQVSDAVTIPGETTAFRISVSHNPDAQVSMQSELGEIDVTVFYNGMSTLPKVYEGVNSAFGRILNGVNYAANNNGLAAVRYEYGSINTSGAEAPNAYGNRVRSGYISISPSKMYSLRDSPGYECRIYQYASDKSFLSYSDYGTTSFNTASNTAYIRVLIKRNPDSVNPFDLLAVPYPVIVEATAKERFPCVLDNGTLVFGMMV